MRIVKAAFLAFVFAGGVQAAEDPQVTRGRALFADAKVSAGNISCANCHPNNGHTDNKTYVGIGVVADGDAQGRSTPTLWGASHRSVYGWAGNAPMLEGNIRGIIVNRMKGAEPAKAPAAVKRGFALFTGAGGCGACHVPGSFDKAQLEDVGLGGTFKVPALWAVSQTAPYFHDGRTKTLEEATRLMWEATAKKNGKPSSPTAAQMSDLLAYLSSL